jgi:hypothetical protein
MSAWGKWFESIADIKVVKGGFNQAGREIIATGPKGLPFRKDSFTGFTIIKAE